MTMYNFITICSGKGLSPVRWQAITWANVDLLLIGSRINFTFYKMHLTMSSAKCGPFCSNPNVLCYLRRNEWPITWNKYKYKQHCGQPYQTDKKSIASINSLSSDYVQWGLNKMADIFADDIFTCIFLNEKLMYFTLNFIEVCVQGPNW